MLHAMNEPEQLGERLTAMAPWHHLFDLGDGITTAAYNPPPGRFKVSLIDPVELQPLLASIYPDGLGGKRFLDCACNAGGYSVLAHRLGADALGFDVRDHWISQARFMRDHYGYSDDRLRFEVCDLLEFAQRFPEERFDITLFKGIFYHLPDPVAGLKLVADKTDDVLILDTGAVSGHEDGFLKVNYESISNPMSGAHKLAWFPTGPRVLVMILNWLGFPETRLIFFRQPADRPKGRIRIVAARSPGRLEGVEGEPVALD